jgi:hypothetical protein
MSEVENWCIEARNLTGILRAAVDEFERISEAYADVRDMGANSDKETIDTCYGNLVDVLNEVKGLQAGGRRRMTRKRRSNRSNRRNRRSGRSRSNRRRH